MCSIVHLCDCAMCNVLNCLSVRLCNVQCVQLCICALLSQKISSQPSAATTNINGSRQIGPQQIGPLVSTPANWVQFTRGLIFRGKIFQGSRGPICWDLICHRPTFLVTNLPCKIFQGLNLPGRNAGWNQNKLKSMFFWKWNNVLVYQFFPR